MTMHWANRIFCFLLAVTVMNIQNADCYFLNKSKMDALQSCHFITKQYIFNCRLEQDKTARKCPRWGTTAHTLIMVPTHTKFIQERLMTCKTKYGKWKCSNCSKFVCSYCSCTPGLMFCTDCFGDHRVDVAMVTSGVTNFGESS